MVANSNPKLQTSNTQIFRQVFIKLMVMWPALHFLCLSGLWAGRPFGADGQSRRADEAAQCHYWLRLLTSDPEPAQPSAMVQSGTLLQSLISPAVYMRQQVNLGLKTPLWNQTSICAGLSLFGFYWSRSMSYCLGPGLDRRELNRG